jgi:hypothetical protein
MLLGRVGFEAAQDDREKLVAELVCESLDCRWAVGVREAGALEVAAQPVVRVLMFHLTPVIGSTEGLEVRTS